MISKLFLILITIISIFLSINSALFLPVSAYLIANIVTNTKDFDFDYHKKTSFYYFGAIFILSLISVFKFI